MHRTAPCSTLSPPPPATKNQQVYNVSSAEAEKPWSRGGDFCQWQGSMSSAGAVVCHNLLRVGAMIPWCTLYKWEKNSTSPSTLPTTT